MDLGGCIWARTLHSLEVQYVVIYTVKLKGLDCIQRCGNTAMLTFVLRSTVGFENPLLRIVLPACLWGRFEEGSSRRSIMSCQFRQLACQYVCVRKSIRASLVAIVTASVA